MLETGNHVLLLEELHWPSAFWQLYAVIYSLGIKLRTCKHYNHTIDEHVRLHAHVYAGRS